MGAIFLAQGPWETPDTMQTFLHYPAKELQAYFEGTFINAKSGRHDRVRGRRQTLYIDRGRYEIRPEWKSGTTGELVTNPLQTSEMILGDGPRGQDFYSKPEMQLRQLLRNWPKTFFYGWWIPVKSLREISASSSFRPVNCTTRPP